VKKAIISLALSVICAAAAFCPCVMADEASPEALPPAYLELPNTVETLKVGLKTGRTSLFEANLANGAGNGFSCGYFDITRKFHPLIYIGSTEITVRPDTAYTLGEEEIGGYHIMFGRTFSNRDEALAYVTPVGGYVSYICGELRAMYGSYLTEEDAENAIAYYGFDASVYLGGESSVCVTEADSSEILFSFDCSDNRSFALWPYSDDGYTETYLGDYLYNGAFEFIRNEARLKVVNYVDVESYVKGVLPYEAIADWHEEALKAQAVCARTYAFNKINAYSADGFDVRCDTYSQVYKGLLDRNGSTDSAADLTAGECVRYKGLICKVYYMSSDGGATESSENVFGEYRPYLVSVKDEYEQYSNSYMKHWEDYYSAENLVNRLAGRGYELEDVFEIGADYSENGNVTELRFVSKSGDTLAVKHEACYSALGLNSIRYTVEKLEDEDGNTNFVFEGSGYGHNCGMSQWGACAMAESFGFDYKGIIAFYFSGAYTA